jgi:predicted RNase H-like HicB family nuclease
MTQRRLLTAIIEREEDQYVALCPELDIASQGSSVEEVKANLTEALSLFFETADASEVARRLRRQRGSRRIGLIASSGGRRLRAHGLDVRAELDVENWFLNDRRDVRSSFYLETPATEFGIQGLELDWTGLCWDIDLVPDAGDWQICAFKGTDWQTIRDETRRRYVLNKYRVLLTRAREGMVIWIPTGDTSDWTRPPSMYDAVARYLESCGIAEVSGA